MLPRENRLVREKGFTRLYKSGQRSASKNLNLVFLKTGQNVSRFGFVVSKKTAAGIVRRNRLKRQLRAVVEALLPGVRTGFDVVLSARGSALNTSYQELQKEVRKLLKDNAIISD